MWKTGVITASWVMEPNGYQRAPWNEYMTKFWQRFGYDELDGLLARIKWMGFEYVELWLGTTGDAGRADLWKGKTPEDVKKLFTKYDLKLASFCPGGIGRGMDADWLLGYAHALGAKLVTGWLGPQPEYWAEMAKLLERYDLRFGIEPHGPEYSIATWDQVRAACAMSDRYGACPDTGGMWRRGLNAVDVIREVLPLMVHVHLKGYNVAEKRNCAPGDDDIGLADVVRLLRDSNYQGIYNIEYEVDHKPDEELKRSRQWMLGILNE
jgi:sugar phosphate isomerase/epimerase